MSDGRHGDEETPLAAGGGGNSSVLRLTAELVGGGRRYREVEGGDGIGGIIIIFGHGAQTGEAGRGARPPHGCRCEAPQGFPASSEGS